MLVGCERWVDRLHQLVQLAFRGLNGERPIDPSPGPAASWAPWSHNPIAERRLNVVDDPGRSVTVTIGQPMEAQPGEWACRFTIDAIDPETRSVRGLIDEEIQNLVDEKKARGGQRAPG